MLTNTFQEERSLIENHFQANFTGAKILFTNTRQKIPTSGPWVRLSILHAASSQISICPEALKRVNGQVVVQVFIKKGTGLQTAYNIADEIENIFSRVQLESIQFRVSDILEVGEIEEYYQVNVSTDFYRNYI